MINMLKENILQLAASLFDETVANRRHLHAWPELSFQEYKTSEFVANKLTDLKIPFEKKANTGIVALLARHTISIPTGSGTACRYGCVTNRRSQ